MLFFYSFIVSAFCEKGVGGGVVKLKRCMFSVYLSVKVLDSMAYWRHSFRFFRVRMLDKFFYLERYSVGGSCGFRIANNFAYYVLFGFGFGACVDFKSVYCLLFFDVFPLGFSYNFDKFVSMGLQIGYSVWINPMNSCRDVFYINFRDVCIDFNIFRYKNVISFAFSKRVRFYSILKCRLESIFTTGWDISLFVDI